MQLCGKNWDLYFRGSSFLFRNCTNQSSLQRKWTKNGIRASLVFFTAAIAALTPYFGSVLGTVGGLTDALQAFVLPPLICLQTQTTRLGTIQRSFYVFICLWGIGTIGLTIYNLVFAILVAEHLTKSPVTIPT